MAVAVVAAALAIARAGLGWEPATGPKEPSARPGPPGPAAASSASPSLVPTVPSATAMRSAWRYARRRGGRVSFAVVDTRGRLRGREADRSYVSASVVKALLLVAELRRLQRNRIPLDEASQRLLTAMITVSDNAAADAIYSRLGDAALVEVSQLARMKRFSVAGHWTTAQVTAADLARLFSDLRRLLPSRYRRLALHLLASVIHEQRWGLPRAARRSWTVHFKGGWRGTESGQLVHQAAWLHNGYGDLAIAVLTDAQPSRLYAIHTIRGIANRLLRVGANSAIPHPKLVEDPSH